MAKIAVEYAFDGQVLNDYVSCRAPVSVIRGPLGSGKTYASCMRLFNHICEQEPDHTNTRRSRWYAIRNTYDELTRTTIADWLALFKHFGKFTKSQGAPVHHLHFRMPDGSIVDAELTFLAMDREDQVGKVRGANITGMWINELKFIPFEIVDECESRCDRFDAGAPNTWAGILADTNSPSNRSWLYHMAEERKPNTWAFHVQPGAVLPTDGINHLGEKLWTVNPNAENLINLPPNYYEKKLQSSRPDWIKVNLANEYGFVQSGKPVHPSYVDSVHCLPDHVEPDGNIEIHLGYDFGRTPAAAFMQRQSNGRVYIFDEFVTDDFSAVSFGNELRSYIQRTYPQMKVSQVSTGDPAGDGKGQATDDTPIRILRAQGLPCNPAHTNQPKIRRAALENPIRQLLMDGRPGLIISPRCKMLREGLAGGFCYRKLMVSGDKFTDEPDKNEFSHIVEAAEYGLLGLGEGHKAVQVSDNNFSRPVVAKQEFNLFG